MAMLRAKQIKLNAAGDILIGGVSGQGTVLAKGAENAVLRATAAGLEYHALTAADIARGAGTVDSALTDIETQLGDILDFAGTTTGERALASTTLATAINEVMGRAAIAKRNATAAPALTDDSSKGYSIGDIWVFEGKAWIAEDVTADAAVWTRIDSGAITDVFSYRGTVDASLAANLPASPETGYVYRVTVAGDFETTGPTVNVGDMIVWNGTAWDVLDNTNTQVAGTSNRITVTGNDDTGFVVDIASDYAGQASIATLGTITTGTWNGTAVGQAFGGTGLTTVTVAGDANKALVVGATGALEYAYVGALRDSAGLAIASVVGGVLVADASAETAPESPALAYTTKAYVESLIASGGMTQAEQDFVVPATPGANYAVTIAAAAIGDLSVFFNGIKLRKTGYTVAGTTVTLVDSVNGYAAEENDVLSVSYLRSAIA